MITFTIILAIVIGIAAFVLFGVFGIFAVLADLAVAVVLFWLCTKVFGLFV